MVWCYWRGRLRTARLAGPLPSPRGRTHRARAVLPQDTFQGVLSQVPLSRHHFHVITLLGKAGAHNTTAHAWRRSKRCVTTCARVTATMRKSTTWSRRFAATRPTSRLDRTNPSTLRLHASYLRLNSGPWEAAPDRTMGATGRMSTAATVADSVADSVIAATRGPLLRIRWRRSQKWPCTLAAAIVACLRSR